MMEKMEFEEKGRNFDVHVNVDGTKEAGRGIGILAISAVPVVLVSALVGVCALYVGIHQGMHEVKQIERQESAQQRADNRVGAEELPKQAIKLTMASRESCLKFDSGYLEGGTLIAYVRNICHQDITYYQIHLSGLAPDGTVVQSRYENTGSQPDIGAGERAEVRIGITNYGGDSSRIDDRIVQIKATITGNE
jgi:hypothetical protein